MARDVNWRVEQITEEMSAVAPAMRPIQEAIRDLAGRVNELCEEHGLEVEESSYDAERGVYTVKLAPTADHVVIDIVKRPVD